MPGENLHYVGTVKLVRDATKRNFTPAIVAVVVAVTIMAVAVTAVEIAATVVINKNKQTHKSEGGCMAATRPHRFLLIS